MKNVIIILLMVVAIANSSAQKIDSNKVPTTVINAFKIKFPTVEKVKWSLENAKEYEAEFDFNKAEMSALYDEKGTLLETETEIKESDLPQTLKSTLAKDFAEYKIREYEKNEVKDIVTFEIEAKKDKKLFELIFDSNGKLIKQEEIKEKDND